MKTCNLLFCWNLQLLTCYSLFRNLPYSTTNILTVEADSISVTLNISGVSCTIFLGIINVFWEDRADVCLLHKITFRIVYGKIFFLIDSFLSSRRLWVAYKPYSKCTIKSGMHQNYWFMSFFSFNCLPDDVLCKIAIWANVLLSIHHETNHPTCHNKLG